MIRDLVAAFTEQGSSASQMTAAKVMGIISGHGRLWPNKLWPISVFIGVDQHWPNQLWPILVF